MKELIRTLRGEAIEFYLRITARERQALVEQYRKEVNPRVRLRAHLLLLPAQGYPWALIAGVLFCRTHTIARRKKRKEVFIQRWPLFSASQRYCCTNRQGSSGLLNPRYEEEDTPSHPQLAGV